jgi:hypothetical protein
LNRSNLQGELRGIKREEARSREAQIIRDFMESDRAGVRQNELNAERSGVVSSQ